MSETKKIRVAVNGAGRIGRTFVKLALTHSDIDMVAVNDLGDVENMAYLLKYDTVYGVNRSSIFVSADKKSIVIDGKNILCLSQKDPAALPWKDLAIDVVVESTGFFTSYEKARLHITAGAKRVVISAPAKSDGQESCTILMGINEEKLKNYGIENIRLKLGRLDEDSVNKFKTANAYQLTEEDSRYIENTIQNLKNDELKEKFRRLLSDALRHEKRK